MTSSLDTLSTTKRPSQARSRATFDKILRSSTAIVLERGVQGLNTNVVAERAGINIGTVYHYFPDKTAILVELYEEQQRRQLAVVSPLLLALPTAPDLDEWIREMFDALLGLHLEHPDGSGMRRAFRAVPEVVELDDRNMAFHVTVLGDLLRERYPSLVARRAYAAARVIMSTTMMFLDVIRDMPESAKELHDEAVVSLQGYFQTLAG
jgi:AcrR family transcriptional regulator